MIDNGKACGLRFDENAIGTHFTPKEFFPDGPLHDSWKLVPFGLPRHRTAPDTAVLANTVALRAQGPVGYKTAALSKPVEAYPMVEVIPPGEISTAPYKP